MGSKEKDHEVSMAKSQVRNSITNLKRVQKVLSIMSDDDNLPAWVQAKITDTEHNTDATAGYMDEDSCPICYEDPCQCLEGTVTEGKRDGKSAKDKNYSLRDWFKGGGWVQTGGKYDGKPCAKQPGQKTKPYCRDADDRASMSKEERNKRARKKRKEDPNPNRKGKAKNVRQESYSNWREEIQLDEGDYRYGSYSTGRYMNLKGELMTPAQMDAYIKSKQSGKKPPVQTDKAHYEPEGDLVDEGKKDACYHKVKASAKVWPSAYASGRLVQCRKKGAANYGKSKKNEEYDTSNWKDDFQPLNIETVNIIEPEPIKGVQKVDEGLVVRGKLSYGSTPGKATNKSISSAVDRAIQNPGTSYSASSKKGETGVTASGSVKFSGRVGGDSNKSKEDKLKRLKKERRSDRQKSTADRQRTTDSIQRHTSTDPSPRHTHTDPSPTRHTHTDSSPTPIREKCWDGYTQKGMKKKGKRLVPNCVKEKYSNWRQELEEDWQKENRKDKTDGMSQKAVNAYKRENPGSKLKTAVTGKVKKGSKDAKRRKSFCSRSDGQRKMHNIDCSKTPDKKICKARRRWKC